MASARTLASCCADGSPVDQDTPVATPAPVTPTKAARRPRKPANRTSTASEAVLAAGANLSLDGLTEAVRAPRAKFRLMDADGRSQRGLDGCQRTDDTVDTLDEANARCADPDDWATTYTIRLRTDVVVVDVDLDGEAGVVATDAISQYVVRCGRERVIVASGRPGHHWVAVNMTSEDDVQALEDEAKRLGITGQLRRGSARLRGLGAPHRYLPVRARLVHPATPAEAAAALGLRIPAPKVPKATRAAQNAAKVAQWARRGLEAAAEYRKALSRATPVLRALSADQDRLAALGTGPLATLKSDGTLDASTAHWTLTWACQARGWTLDQYLVLVLDARNKGCRSVWARRGGDALGWATRTWDLAAARRAATESRPLAQPVDPNVAHQVALIRVLTEAITWGQARPGILAALEVLLLAALRHGTLTGLGYSQREIMVAAGITSRARIEDYLHALADNGIIAVIERFSFAGAPAHRYELLAVAPALAAPSGGPVIPGGVVTSTGPIAARMTPLDGHVGHPIWLTGAGLGKAAWNAYRHLNGARLDTAALARLCGYRSPTGAVSARNLQTMKGHLARLQAHGLATQHADGTWKRTRKSLDVAAKALGADVAAADLVTRLAAERADFAVFGRMVKDDPRRVVAPAPPPDPMDCDGPTAEDLKWLHEQDIALPPMTWNPVTGEVLDDAPVADPWSPPTRPAAAVVEAPVKPQGAQDAPQAAAHDVVANNSDQAPVGVPYGAPKPKMAHVVVLRGRAAVPNGLRWSRTANAAA